MKHTVGQYTAAAATSFFIRAKSQTVNEPNHFTAGVSDPVRGVSTWTSNTRRLSSNFKACRSWSHIGPGSGRLTSGDLRSQTCERRRLNKNLDNSGLAEAAEILSKALA